MMFVRTGSRSELILGRTTNVNDGAPRGCKGNWVPKGLASGEKKKIKGKRKQCQQNLRENTLCLPMKVCSHRVVQISSQMREKRTFLTEVT